MIYGFIMTFKGKFWSQ